MKIITLEVDYITKNVYEQGYIQNFYVKICSSYGPYTWTAPSFASIIWFLASGYISQQLQSRTIRLYKNSLSMEKSAPVALGVPSIIWRTNGLLICKSLVFKTLELEPFKQRWMIKFVWFFARKRCLYFQATEFGYLHMTPDLESWYLRCCIKQ